MSTPDQLNRELNAIAPTLTPDTTIEVDRKANTVLIDRTAVRKFDPGDQNLMEEFADVLWTHVQDLRAAQAGWSA